MRIAPTLAGAVLAVAAALVLLFGGSLTARRSVLEVGGLTVTAEEQRPLAPWLLGVVFFAGVALVLTEARRKA